MTHSTLTYGNWPNFRHRLIEGKVTRTELEREYRRFLASRRGFVAHFLAAQSPERLYQEADRCCCPTDIHDQKEDALAIADTIVRSISTVEHNPPLVVAAHRY